MTPKAQTWLARVEEWRRSGLTSREFSKGKTFTSRALLWWSSELNRRAREADGVNQENTTHGLTTQFARVVATPASQAADLRVRVGRAEVLVQRGFDQTLLVEVVRALEAAE